MSKADLIACLELLRDEINALLTELPTLSLESVAATPPPTGPVLEQEQAPEFRSISHELHHILSKADRQAEGIFFTPKKQRDRLFEVLETHKIRPSTVLEPSFGSGEFLYDVQERWSTATCVGVEFNKTIFNKFKAPPRCSVVNADFLTYKSEPAYDLILGNPPYFVVKEKDPACMTGRGNIFVQFIYKCLVQHLKPDGILAFILPTSFYNCSYYEPCRNYILKNTTVLYVENMDGGFYDTAQDTMLLVIKNTALPPSAQKPFFVLHGGSATITPKADAINTLLRGSTSLADLGLSVKTGEVVWNQHKEKLHDKTGTLVVYSSNIVKNKLALNNLKGEKKQYICGFTRPPVEGPALCVNRGYGNKFILSYVRIDAGVKFYGENHINVVTGPAAAIDRLEKSFTDPRTSAFIRDFVGNGALSKTELEILLPVF